MKSHPKKLAPAVTCLSFVTASALFVSAAKAGPGAAPLLEPPAITKMPVLRRFVEATYPERALAEQVEAVVVFDIDIDSQGRVEKVELVQPAEAQGFGFEEAAHAAISQFEFQPAEAGGEPIPVRITYRYGFVLPKVAKAPEAPTAAPAPVVNFAGYLRERGVRSPIAGVKVTVFRGEGEAAQGFEAVSDAQGAFEFFSLEPGEWRVLVEPQDYFPLRTAETVQPGERLEVTYYLERRTYNPLDVLVEASRPKKEVTRVTLQSQEIERIPGTFGDPVQVVTNMPSVARAFGSALMVRGSAPEDTRAFVAGSEVPMMYHFWGLRSVLPAGILEYVDFYPGNFSPYYGRATGGILDVRLKKPEQSRATGYLDVCAMDTGALLSVPIGDNAGIVLAARRSYIDFVLDAVMPDDADTTFSTAPRYYDYQVLTHWQPSARHKLETMFFASDDRFELISKNPADLSTSYKSGDYQVGTAFVRGMVRHTYTASESIKNELSLALGQDESREQLGTQFKLHADVLQLQLRDTVTAKVSETLGVVGGVDALVTRSDWLVYTHDLMPQKEGDPPKRTLENQLISTRIEGKKAYYPAAYAELDWHPTANWTFLPGLRVDYFGATAEWAVDPRLTARYRVAESVALKGGIGVFHQEPQMDELDASFGNPNLSTERAIHYSAGVEWRPWKQVLVDLTGFYKAMDHMVARSGAVVERDGVQVPERYNNQGEGRVVGLDLLVRHEFANNFFGWVAYTLSRAERKEPGERDYRLFDYDQTHILTILGSYQLPHHWELGVRWRLVSGNPTTPIRGATFESDQDEFSPTYGRTNSARLPLFHQLDVRIDKRWVYDGWMLNAYIDIQNTYNRGNTEESAYRYDYSEQESGGGMPILPILGLRAEF